MTGPAGICGAGGAGDAPLPVLAPDLAGEGMLPVHSVPAPAFPPPIWRAFGFFRGLGFGYGGGGWGFGSSFGLDEGIKLTNTVTSCSGGGISSCLNK